MVSHAHSESRGKALIQIGAVESRSAGGGRDLGERHDARYSFNECPICRADTVKDDRFRRDGPSRRARRPGGIGIVEAGVFFGVIFRVTERRDPRRVMSEIPAIRGAIDRGVELCRPGYAWCGQGEDREQCCRNKLFHFPRCKDSFRDAGEGFKLRLCATWATQVKRIWGALAWRNSPSLCP